MNKKVSTILTAGLMLCGTLFSSTSFAAVGDQINISNFSEGTKYALVSTGYYDSSNGWTERNSGSELYVSYENGAFKLVDDSKGLIFSVTSTTNASGELEYTFTSVNGYTFSVGDHSAFLVNETTSTYGAVLGIGTLSSNASGFEYEVGAEIAADTNGYYSLCIHSSGDSDNAAQLFMLEEVETESLVSDSELNALYNNKGFNLGPEVEGNLFSTGQIWAYFTTGENVTTDGTTATSLSVPAGLYFFTDHVTFTNGKTDWYNSTLIAVSPTEDNAESTDSDRAKGEGFRLVEVKGSDFIYYGNTTTIQGSSISIDNAAFTGMRTYNYSDEEWRYAFSLANFHYQGSDNYAPDAVQSVENVELAVVSYDSGESTYIVTQVIEDSYSYVFFLSDSGILDGIELLNTTQSPAVYTIKFVSGNSELNNKYLTVGSSIDSSNNTTFRWEAKGAAITDTTYPIFQYVITSVKQEGGEKYTEVTFTNRETNESFTTQLFPEDTNRYSLSESLRVMPFTVNTTTYAVEESEKSYQTTNKNVIVELTKIANVDEYAGFLNVDDKSMYTLSFARDVNDTSNKLYVGVDNENGQYLINENDDFATDNNSAAQWQFVKSNKPSTISRVYVYYDATNEMVNDVADGDKVSAYTYSLQYVEDGSETSYYLSDNIDEKSPLTYFDDIDDLTNTEKFYIKENVDGSVSFFINYSTADPAFSTSDMQVAKASKLASFDVEYNNDLNGTWNSNNRPQIYYSVSEANNLKVYLADEAESTSWEDAGYVTIQSELGNYVSMNEDRDGIIINENEAIVYYLHKTDESNIVPSFFISEGTSDIDEERLFMFNPVDSANYYVATGAYNTKYEVAEGITKVMFKTGVINETCDTLTMTIKGEEYKKVAESASNSDSNIWGGINRFKFQIVETEDGDGLYYIRQPKGDLNMTATRYIYSINDKLALTPYKDRALQFYITGIEAPTANESVTTSEVKVVAADGAVNIKNAAGKNVVISTILGQIVANETLTSDNATISVPSGIVIVSVEGEEAVKANVR